MQRPRKSSFLKPQMNTVQMAKNDTPIAVGVVPTRAQLGEQAKRFNAALEFEKFQDVPQVDDRFIGLSDIHSRYITNNPNMNALGLLIQQAIAPMQASINAIQPQLNRIEASIIALDGATRARQHNSKMTDAMHHVVALPNLANELPPFPATCGDVHSLLVPQIDALLVFYNLQQGGPRDLKLQRLRYHCSINVPVFTQ